MFIIALSPVVPKNMWRNSKQGASGHANEVDLTTLNLTLYNEKEPEFAPPIRIDLQDLASSVLL